MSWFAELFASHAKKGYKKGVRKHGPRPNFKKDPAKYRGGKGSRYNRTHTAYEGIDSKLEVVTKHEFIDNRANKSSEPVFVKTTRHRRDNPKARKWRQVGEPAYSIISKDVFLMEISEANRNEIVKRGNFFNIRESTDYPDTRIFLSILDGDRLEETLFEYRLVNDPGINDF